MIINKENNDKTMGLFLEYGSIQLSCIKLGPINYDNNMPIQESQHAPLLTLCSLM